MEVNRILAKKLEKFNGRYSIAVPSTIETYHFVDSLIQTLFQIRRTCRLDEEGIALELDRCAITLHELLHSIRNSLKRPPEEIVQEFFGKIPGAFEMLTQDADCIIRFDPASTCLEEVVLCYPGFYCISVYRMAHILYELEVPILPRIMSEYAHSNTGIDIHPGAKIDSPFFIDHGTGIVIGETAEIGKDVKIYQGVTLGALTVEKSMSRTKRHPTIEDNVIIYAGSTILGGKTVIGHDSVLGGNTWITESILPFSVVYRNHRVEIKNTKDFKEPLDFVI
jgi:serine O-acetyltransferase